MTFSELIEKYKREWSEMDQKYKVMMGCILVGGAVLMYVRGKQHDEIMQRMEQSKQAAQEAQREAQSPANKANNGMAMSVIPQTTRNQGLEDMQTAVDAAKADAKKSSDAAQAALALASKLTDRLSALENKPHGSPQLHQGTGKQGNTDLEESLPPPVDFNQPTDKNPSSPVKAAQAGGTDFSMNTPVGSEPQNSTAMHIWDPLALPARDTKKPESQRVISIPRSSGIESVMLTGINARSNASGGSPAGSVMSANSVGAPFVSRVKGSAMLPNGYKVSDLGDCFISGSGVAVLSSERANVIADWITCIDKKGVIFEAPLKAYGVDLDGIQGISGRVVTKQGSLLEKAALAGLASGLGTALAPTALTGYNSMQTSGSQQGMQLPNPSLIAESSLGSGVSSATAQLSKFYLDYAKEMFPVVEVDAGTRITWILKETVDLVPNKSK